VTGSGREGRGIDPGYLREHQYKDPSNLNARIALHAKYSQADVPWFSWLVRQVEWPEGADVLEVGCGTGLLWVRAAAELPRLRLTLTDLSEGMVQSAVAAVAPLSGMELVGSRTCDARELPFDDDTFDVVVADHMLYHVPDPGRAAAEFARVLRPDGALLAATNGPDHLDAISEVSRSALGWSPLDSLDGRFGRSTGGAILRTAFGSVSWQLHPSTMVCTDPTDVVAFIASTAAGRDASPEQLVALEEAVAARFAHEEGQMTITTEAGCFVATDPGGTLPRSEPSD
jgi:SAM-dependent methyltransferase